MIRLRHPATGVVAHVDDATAERLRAEGWRPVDEKPAEAPKSAAKPNPRRRK